MLTVLLVAAVLLALGATVTTVAVKNLNDAGLDRQAAGAQDIAEGGVAAAIEYIRGNGLGGLSCMESNPSACSGVTNPWSNPTTPATVAVSGETFKVWIGVVSRWNPPSTKYTIVRVHSTGTAGGAPGQRVVTQDLRVAPFEFPIGVYAGNATGAGDSGVHRESLFAQSCVQNRLEDPSPNGNNNTGNGGGVQFFGEDAFYHIPAAAHSTDVITTANNSCNNNKIHANGKCNSSFRFDQDSMGAPLDPTVDATCYNKNPWYGTDPNAPVYPTTSKFTLADLQSTYDYTPNGLTPAQYDALKARAQSQSSYYNLSGLSKTTLSAGTDFTLPNATIYPQGVLYLDLNKNQTVTISGSDVPAGYSRDTTDGPTCSPNSLIIVVRNGGLKLASNLKIVAAIFVPEGNYAGGGTTQVIGTLFAASIVKLTGTQDFMLDNCFLNNLPGGIMDIQPRRYHEVDR